MMGDQARKPPYRIPLMAELPNPCGLTVLSTFSGCGGSCLGFRMAGYRTLAAVEFIEAARDVYRANFPGVPVEARDIRTVTAKDLLRAAGVNASEVDVMEGSPPCASFSTAGKREQDWGKIKKYSDGSQRTDDLFFEFVRLLRGVMPRAFVAENVSGLVKGKAKGYFLEILAALKQSGYRVRAQVLDAQWLGVPQRRQRLIFVGVRDDLGRTPVFPTPLPYRYSVRDALPWIMAQGDNGGYGSGGYQSTIEPSPTVGASPRTGNGRFSPSQVVAGVYGEPTARELADANIERFAIGPEAARLKPGESSARYPSLVRAATTVPSQTITACGGNLSAAAVVAPDAKRKFTIGELKRICGFPDDFVLLGTYAQQWERLGRAVPPPMMRAVAERLRDDVLT